MEFKAVRGRAAFFMKINPFINQYIHHTTRANPIRIVLNNSYFSEAITAFEIILSFVLKKPTATRQSNPDIARVT